MGVAGRILITISVVAKTFLQLAVWNGTCLTAVRVSTRMNPSMGQSLSWDRLRICCYSSFPTGFPLTLMVHR
jgi:hypothetical protein